MTKASAPVARQSDTFDDLLGYHLRRLSVLVMADLTESLAPLGLKPADASVLFVIASTPDITQSGVGRLLGIRRANMAPLIAALISQGLIDREAADGRSHALRLSAAGQLLARRAKQATRAHEDRLFGSLSKTARHRLIEQLRGLWQD